MHRSHPAATGFHWLMIVIGIMLMMLLVGCNRPSASSEEPVTQSGGLVEGIPFTHPSLGFTVEMPPTWQDKIDVVSEEEENGVRMVSFNYTGGGEPHTFLFRIAAYPIAVWEESVNGTEPLLNNEAFARTQTHVYTLIRALDNPYNGQSQVEYGAMAQDIDEVLNSFELAGAEPYTYVSYAVYFGNDALNVSQDCSVTFPVMRNVEDKVNIPLSILTKLFAGPTQVEKEQGYTSFFSRETAGAIKSLTVKAGTAYVNLNDIRSIIPNASSSCGSQAMLSQIQMTLMQFPEIQRVILAIDGNPQTFYDWIQIGCSTENDQCDTAPFGSATSSS